METLFVDLFRYQPSDYQTPTENFSTVILTSLLKYSIKNKTKLFLSFLQKFKIVCNINIEDYDKYEIWTQTNFNTIYNKHAIPDITLIDAKNEKYYFFEVKIDADLNIYEVDNKIKNQIDLYNGIKVKKKDVFLISKQPYGSSVISKDKLIRWYSIYDFFCEYGKKKDIESFLVKNALCFFKEKGMTKPLVKKEIISGLKSLDPLLQQLKEVVIMYDDNPKVSYSSSYLGWTFKKKKSKNYWIGIYYNTGDRIQLWEDNEYQDVYIFNKEYFNKSSEDQIISIRNWIENHF